MAANLSVTSHTSLPEALSMQPSMAKKFFDSKAFAGWEKSREAENKTQAAIVERTTGVIRAIVMLAKAIARKP